MKNEVYETNMITMHITIEVADANSTMIIGDKIHNALRGTEDYIDNRVVLNCTDDPNKVHLYQFYDSTTDVLEVLRKL